MAESVKSEQLFQFLDEYLDVPAFADYDGAVNGLQVEGPLSVSRVAAAVDASEETIRAALEAGADLLLVHHGLFWGGSSPIVGPHFRKLKALIQGPLALYSAHLPLDAHPEVGNCAILARAVGIPADVRFGEYRGQALGWQGPVDQDLQTFVAGVEAAVGGPVRVIPRSPDAETRAAGSVAVVTGAAASMLGEAARSGVDTLLTGEAPHHAYHEARELGVNLVLAGHYATEVWGVRALAEKIRELHGLEWVFIDVPTGF